MSKTLAAGLSDHIRLSHSRLETLSWLVMLIMQQGSVCLWRLASYVSTLATTDSVRRRFYRFFQHVKLDSGVSARLIVGFLGLADKPWFLAIDRTNWDLGRVPINILMVSVMY